MLTLSILVGCLILSQAIVLYFLYRISQLVDLQHFEIKAFLRDTRSDISVLNERIFSIINLRKSN